MMQSILLQITQIPQTAAAQAKVVVNATTEDLTFWNMTLKGGWIMIPIFLLSLVAIYIIIERYFEIQKAVKEDQNFMNEIKSYILQDKLEEARIRCKSNSSPVALMMEKGISRIGKPLADIKEAIENVGNLEILKLEKNLAILATVSGAAPMLGFLGTVLGMIRAFYDMANAGGNFSISMLSNGIYTAMVTTVAGLIVGICAYLGYNILVSRVNKVVYKLQLRTTEFLDLLNEPTQ